MRWFVLSIIVVGMLGCKEAGPLKYRLSGNVTLDGAPLQEAVILLESPGGKAAGEMAFVRNGSYEVQLPPGPRIARITSEREIVGKLDKLGMQMREQILPAKYNVNSDLKVDIAGDQTKNFELSSK